MATEIEGQPPAATSVEALDQDIAVRLAYGSDLHGQLLTKLNEMRRLSDQFLATRKSVWAEIDKRLRGFIDLKAMAKLADGTRSANQVEMPFDRAIVVPVTAAMLDVRRAQFLSIIGARNPMIQLSPTEGSDVRSAHATEMNIEYDLRASRFLVGSNTFFRDADRYGQGWFYSAWEREFGHKLQAPVFKGEEGFVEYMAEQGFEPEAARLFFPRAQMAKPELFEATKEFGLKREYNLVRCIDPTLMITDPRAKVWNPDKMEFCGHTDYDVWTYLWSMRREAPGGGLFFNLQQAKTIAEGKAAEGEASVNEKPADRTHTRLFAGDPGSFKLDWLTWRCIPKDHSIDTSEEATLWQFVVANEAVIIGAWELDHDHGKMPYVCGESQPDQHTVYNPGSAELADGVQRIIDFNYATYSEHLNKALHNAGLVHEDLVMIEDILYPTPGGHIRVTDEVAQRVLNNQMNLGSAFQQLLWPDATRGHLESAQWIYEFGMRLLAANDPQQGMPTEDKRTLGEVNAIMASSSARVAATAKVLDEQAIAPLVEMLIANLQQYLTMDRYVRVVGDYQKEFGSEIAQIRRDDIWGNYDYVPIDGSSPPDPARQADSVERLLSVVGPIPQLNGQMPLADGSVVQFNYHQALKMWAKNLGFHNVDDLLEVIQQQPPGVMPDEAIAQGVQAGDIVPIGG